MLRTHLAMSLFIAALFWHSISDKILFSVLLIFATIIPDIDSANSYISSKSKPISKILGFFTRHRGFFHSMTFAFVLSLIIAIFAPIIALPIFLGYSLHIFADSFTKEGVQTLWPLSYRTEGKFRTGSWFEYILIGIFLLLTASIILYG